MKPIISYSSAGPKGPISFRFSHAEYGSTAPLDDEDDIIVDYDTGGGVISVELIALTPAIIERFVAFAHDRSLDITGAFARPNSTGAIAA